MEQLTVKQLKSILEEMPDSYMIYLGDDEELNGIHEAYFCQKISSEEANSLSMGAWNKRGVMIS